MTGTEIPIVAWQQAAIVVLFAMFVVWILTWVSNIQKQWQAFMEKRDNFWQSWMEKQNSQSTSALQEVTAALKELACEVREHDEKVERRIGEAVKQVKPPNRKV